MLFSQLVLLTWLGQLQEWSRGNGLLVTIFFPDVQALSFLLPIKPTCPSHHGFEQEMSPFQQLLPMHLKYWFVSPLTCLNLWSSSLSLLITSSCSLIFNALPRTVRNTSSDALAVPYTLQITFLFKHLSVSVFFYTGQVKMVGINEGWCYILLEHLNIRGFSCSLQREQEGWDIKDNTAE